MTFPLRFAAVGVALGTLTLGSSSARAETIIKDPNPPKYSVEIEPHLNLQYLVFQQYKANGLGPGVRFGIPIMSPGFIKSINDSIAISFGADVMYLRPTDRANDCGPNGCDYKSFWALYFPVTMQWNFWLTDKWSVFGEPGAVVQTAATECERIYGCKKPSWIGPAFYAGARYHFSDSMALTMRVGWPNGLSVGLSIF
jgi:hypothetical protein